MKGKRYSEEQIIRILREVESGKSVAQVCREHGVAEPTVYRWRSKYSGMDLAELHRLKELEEENRRLKKLVADQALRERIKELANKHKRYGYRRIADRLRKEGWHVNVKRVHRLWKSEGLWIRRKPKNRRSLGLLRPYGRAELMTRKRATVLLDHYLKQLKLPTMLREYKPIAHTCAQEDQDHISFLLRLSERETIEREQRAAERRIRAAKFRQQDAVLAALESEHPGIESLDDDAIDLTLRRSN